MVDPFFKTFLVRTVFLKLYPDPIFLVLKSATLCIRKFFKQRFEIVLESKKLRTFT